MKLNNLILPHPILGQGDDVTSECLYIDGPNLHKTDVAYEISFEIGHNNGTIQDLINAGKASYCCEVRCSETLYRNIFFSENGNFHIAIPRTDLRNKVEFNLSCTALVDIANYNNPASHSDFHEFSFNIQKGEPLAIFESFDFNADIQYHKLKAASSFMTIIPKQSDSELTDYILDDNKIQIRLPREVYETYKVLGKRKDFAPIIHASIVQNALTVALFNYEEHLENGKTWAEVIQYRLQHEHDLNNGSEKFDPNMIPELVQKILGHPDKRMINQLNTFFQTNSKED